ncbi:MOSC domain-containing protein [Leifsonia poae]|nr:MOSC domain-containing protein [Leifsonia poae]
MAELLAVCRVEKLIPDAGNVGVTAIDKRPATKPLRVRPYGLYGDVQADRKHHGGLTKALYAYAEEDAGFWAGELGRDIPAGLFGENLRTAGLDVNGAEIGERWSIGDGLVVEVTCPRTPCATFQRRMAEPQWVKRFTDVGLPGAYLRIVHAGTIAAGDPVDVVSRPGHGVSVASWFTGADELQADALEASERAGAVRLVPEMHESIAKLRVRIASASGAPASENR